MYHVKTRNWHCKRWTLRLLSIAKIAGACRGDSYDDGDGKLYLDTKNPLRAWAVWAYFMALRRFSGGWTYIVRPGKQADGNYLSIY